MLVVLANDLPPAVRGRMKLWFIEPRPNVFVSGVKDSVAVKVVDYMFKHCTSKAGLVIFRTTPEAPGYKIYNIGQPRKEMIDVCGLQLIVESLR